MIEGLHEGMPVEESGGKVIGRVHEAGLVDDHTSIPYFTVRRHRIGGEFVMPERAVRDVRDGKVLLDIPRELANRMPEFTGRDPTTAEMQHAASLLGDRAHRGGIT